MNNNELLELDKELAMLLGYKDISKGNFYGDSSRWCGVCPEMNKRVYIPRWTMDDGAAFRLAVEHEISLSIGKCVTIIDIEHDTIVEHHADFPDKFSAVRVAIVQATINKLKGN